MKEFAFIAVLTLALSPMTQADAENGALSAVMTREADGEFGPWIGRGELIYQSVNLDTGRLGWYIYHNVSGNNVLLSGRLDGINDLLREKIVGVSAEKFLAEYLADLLTGTMAPAGSFVITKRSIDGFASKDSRAAILRTYILEPAPHVVSNEWILDVNVASGLGGIERWHVSGRLFPIQIYTFNRTISEPNNSFPPMLVTGVGGSVDAKR
jgi:hypothetical protein